MRSPVSRVAAAIVFIFVIGGVSFWFHGVGTTPAFAEFLEPILNPKTVRYKMTSERTSPLPGMARMMGMPAETQKDSMKATTAVVMMLDANRSRTEWEYKMVNIRDGGQGKSLWLYPAEKRATLSNNTNKPNNKNLNGRDPVARYRSLLLDARDKPDVKRESLGEKDIDGRHAIGFRISRPGMVMCLWGDPKTGLPVRVETTSALWPNIKTIMSDFEFNLDMDESLFSLEPPAGYEVKVQDHTIENSHLAEKDLIEMFRQYGKSSRGRLPYLLDMEWITHTALLTEWCVANLVKTPMAKREQENQKTTSSLQRGMEFVVSLQEKADWHYAGRGVLLGAADTPIFWYRPKDSKKYRVIYADLSVHEADTSPSIPVRSDAQMEKDLIEMFRLYGKLSNVPLPDSLDVKSFLVMLQRKNRPSTFRWLLQKPNEKSDQELAESMVELMQGLMFIEMLPNEADAHYAGKGVSLGAADKPIFWYLPKNAKKYRVIYADLSVREVDTPPDVHNAQPVPGPSSPKK
jgi:outer membrane lipoprotein-sorting protein